MSILTANNICVSYQGLPVIQDISLSLDKNELVCVLGVSGVGKSTLFNVLSGVLTPDSGSVYLNSTEITGKAGSISYMQQKDLLLPFKTIIDNVSLPLVIKGEGKKNAREKTAQYFAQFGLSGCENKYPSQLSGGMRQRAALLRTYLFKSEAMLLDEPFSALDAITRSAMQRWFQRLQDTLGICALFITHDIDEAIFLSDRIYIMTGIPGRITNEIVIKKPKPHNDDFATSDKFMEYKRKILDILKNDKFFGTSGL